MAKAPREEPFGGDIRDRRVPSIPAGEVTPDLVRNARLERTSAGIKLFTSAVVENVRGGPTNLLWNAMNAAGIPRYGEMHGRLGIPVNRLGVQLVEDSAVNARVEIDYGVDAVDAGLFDQNPDDPNAPPRLEVSSTLQSARTEFEYDSETGNPKPIVITFNRPNPDTQASDILVQPASVEYMLPMSIVRFYRRERDDPIFKSRGFVGHVNSTDVFGDGPRMWLITRLDGVTVDRGATWNVTYEFQRHSLNWDADVYYEDKNGRRHKDATVANGGIRLDVRALRQANFFDLRLTF